MRDHALLTAVKTKWDASTTVPDSITGGLYEPPAQTTTGGRPVYPYATMEASPQEILPSAGGGEIDKRRLKFTVYHRDKDALATAMGLVDAEFYGTNGAESAQTLTLSSGTWIQTQRAFGQSDSIRRAQKINTETTWMGELNYLVWISR